MDEGENGKDLKILHHSGMLWSVACIKIATHIWVNSDYNKLSVKRVSLHCGVLIVKLSIN